MTRQATHLSLRSGALLLGLSLALPVQAESAGRDPAGAQALFDQGKKLMAEGKPLEACPKFAESQRLDPGVGTLLNLAACYETAGQTASAWSQFLEAESAARTENNAEAARVAHTRAGALVPKLSRIVISVAGAGTPAEVPGLEVRRDDALIGRAQWGVAMPVDPGVHRIHASAPSYEPWDQELEVKGQGANVAITVPALRAAAPSPPVSAAPAAPAPPAATPAAPPSSAPAPAPPPAHESGFGATRALALGAGVVGVAGLTLGTVFGLKAKSKHDSAEEHCGADNMCSAQGVSLRSDAISAGNVSTVAFVVGVAGVAGAAVLWFTAKPDNAGAPAVGLGPGSVALRGAF
jgi:hypothetical protein